ncbi:MAG: hypothetical protein AB1Z22_03850 [Synechococcaceae cyanobacterium]
MRVLAAPAGLTGPAWAQARGTEPLADPAAPPSIRLDGHTLFNLWPSRSLSAEQRSSRVNGRQEQVVASGRPVRLTVEEANNLPVLNLNGPTLVTVRERDVPEGLEAREQAPQWGIQLESTIAQALQERTPEHVVRMLPRLLEILLAALGLHLLLRLWRRWCPDALAPCPPRGSAATTPTASCCAAPWCCCRARW